MDNINSFEELYKREKEKEYFMDIIHKVNTMYANPDITIFPERDNIFASMRYTPLNKVKVVVIGQDPYHGVGEAHGLSFSVLPGVKTPPSLQNIYKELHTDLGLKIPNNGYLKKWADQGVLLLNAVLTVEKDKPASHSKLGWQTFTTEVIKLINTKEQPVVFLLWGNNAKQKKQYITNPNHLILESVHPSPFSANNGFFGCKHFSKTNEFLKANNLEPIDWQIEDI